MKNGSDVIMIKFVSDLWQVGGFLLGTPVSSINKTDRHDTTEILLKVALKRHNLDPNPYFKHRSILKKNQFDLNVLVHCHCSCLQM
jgi:hypothetical protein